MLIEFTRREMPKMGHLSMNIKDERIRKVAINPAAVEAIIENEGDDYVTLILTSQMVLDVVGTYEAIKTQIQESNECSVTAVLKSQPNDSTMDEEST